MLWVPLLILCIGAIGAGYLGIGASGDWIHKFLQPRPRRRRSRKPLKSTARVSRTASSAMLGFGVGIPLVGILIAFYFYKVNRHAAEIAANTPFLRPIVKFLYNKWYIDEIYNIFLLKPLWILAHILAGIDRFVIDGLVFIVSFIPQIIGYSLKPTQRGVLQRYAVGMIAGLAAVVLGVIST